MPIVISVINHKGGTGKTSTVINLGKALTDMKKKVMLIDLDPQASLTFALGIKKPSLTMANVMLREVAIEKVLIVKEAMLVAPASMELSDSELSLSSFKYRETVLRYALEKVQSVDYILIDCSARLSLLNLNALLASDKVLIPVLVDALSLEGLRLVITSIDDIKKAKLNPTLEIAGILPVLYDNKKRISKAFDREKAMQNEFYNTLQSDFSDLLFKTSIRKDIDLIRSTAEGMSALEYRPSGVASADYRRLANELLQRITAKAS